MSNNIGIVIIVVSVVGILSFLVLAIQDFNNAAELKTSLKVSEKEILLNARLDSLEANDSILTETIYSQQKKIEILNSNIVNLRQNINTLTSAVSQQ